MLRRSAIAALLLLGTVTTPGHAQSWPELNKENIGKGIGAITGAIIGSNIGGGRGRTAAIAAGALAGYWAGGKIGASLSQQDRRGIDQATNRAISSGKATAWRNPDTGTRTRVSVRNSRADNPRNLKPALNRLPTIELINAYYVPSTRINVRGGPGTEFAVLSTIGQGQKVPVVGKVVDSNWYLIAEQGKASGFLYAPLMSYADKQADWNNAIRDASHTLQPGRGLAQQADCRLIRQTVSLRSGDSESRQFKACRQANGNWVKV